MRASENLINLPTVFEGWNFSLKVKSNKFHQHLKASASLILCTAEHDLNKCFSCQKSDEITQLTFVVVSLVSTFPLETKSLHESSRIWTSQTLIYIGIENEEGVKNAKMVNEKLFLLQNVPYCRHRHLPLTFIFTTCFMSARKRALRMRLLFLQHPTIALCNKRKIITK